MRIALRLARLLARTRRYALAFIPVGVAVGLGVAVLLSLRAAELSPEQAATAAFGAADGSTSVQEQIRPGARFPDLPAVGQQADESQLTSFVNWRLPTGRLWSGLYIEQPLPSFSQEGKVVLRSGRWPTGPGELVITSSTPFALKEEVTSDPTGLGGVVVGVVGLPFEENPPQVLALPGGWEQWDIGQEAADLAGLRAQVTHFWRADEPIQVATELNLLAQEDGVFAVSGTVAQAMSKAQVSAQELLEQGLPATLVIVMGTFSSAVLVARFHRRNLSSLSAVGVPRSTLRTATALGAAAGAVVAVVLGYGMGLLVTLGTRRILDSTSLRELRPWEWGDSILAADLALAVTVIIILAVALSRGRRRRTPRLPRIGRRLLPWVAAGTALGLAMLSYTPLPSFWVLLGIVAGSAALAACLAVGLLDRGTQPEIGPRLAGLRLIRSRRHELGGLTAALTAAVTVLAATLAIAGGATAHLNRVSGTGYPPGLAIFLPSSLSTSAADTAQRDFEGYVGVEPGGGVEIDYGLVNVGGEAVPGWVFSSIEDAERVFGDLSPGQRDVLRHGALTPKVTGSPEAGQVGVDWALRWLQAVTVSENVPLVDTQAATLYPGLSPDQDRLAADWAEVNGFSPALVQATEQAPDLAIPWPTQMATAGFGLVVVAVVFFAIRSELAAYRGLLGTFAAMGLGPAWITRVGATLGWRIGTVAALSAFLGTCSAVLLAYKPLMGAIRLTGVPWIAVFILCGAVVLGSAGGGGLAARNSSGRDRTA